VKILAVYGIDESASKRFYHCSVLRMYVGYAWVNVEPTQVVYGLAWLPVGMRGDTKWQCVLMQ
jgi:hypothetical protein